MGNPETKENEVEFAIGCEAENIVFDIGDGRDTEPESIDLDHLRGGINYGDGIRNRRKTNGPESSSPCYLQNVPVRSERLELRYDLFDFLKPLGRVDITPVVSSLAQKPLVIFGGSSTVVIDLLGQSGIEIARSNGVTFHNDGFTLGNRLTS